MPQEDESQYDPLWRHKLCWLRLVGRLHELRAQDPKPANQEEEIVASLTGSAAEHKQTIRRRRINPCLTTP